MVLFLSRAVHTVNHLFVVMRLAIHRFCIKNIALLKSEQFIVAKVYWRECASFELLCGKFVSRLLQCASFSCKAAADAMWDNWENIDKHNKLKDNNNLERGEA